MDYFLSSGLHEDKINKRALQEFLQSSRQGIDPSLRQIAVAPQMPLGKIAASAPKPNSEEEEEEISYDSKNKEAYSSQSNQGSQKYEDSRFPYC